jgi:hypothetical protein
VLVMVGTSEGVGVKRYWEISWGIMQDAVIIKMINAMIDLLRAFNQAPWV